MPEEQFGKPERLKLTLDVSVESKVTRTLNGIRLAVLGIIVTIGFSGAAATPGSGYTRAAVGIGSFLVVGALIKVKWTQHLLMAAMEWLTED